LAIDARAACETFPISATVKDSSDGCPTGNLGRFHRVPLDRDDLIDDLRLAGM
jgi:hypothetical protein